MQINPISIGGSNSGSSININTNNSNNNKTALFGATSSIKNMKNMSFVATPIYRFIFTIDTADTDFTGSTFRNVDFSECSFAGSIFKKSTFINCRFIKVTGTEINFEGCVFQDTVFLECHFIKSIFTYSKFIQCKFNERNNSALDFINHLFDDNIDPVTCILTESIFSYTKFINSCFHESNLTNTDFSMAVITNVKLINVILDNANLEKATLDTVTFKPYQLKQANFKDATFTKNCSIDSNMILDKVYSNLEAQAMFVLHKEPVDLHSEFLTTIFSITDTASPLKKDLTKTILTWFFDKEVSIINEILPPLYNNTIYSLNTLYVWWILCSFVPQFHKHSQAILELQSWYRNNNYNYWLPEEITHQILNNIILLHIDNAKKNFLEEQV